MKNLTIKTFIMFIIMAVLIMGTVYITLFCLSPYSSSKKYMSYIETTSKTLADSCMNISKAEAEKKIYGFGSSIGAYTELLNADEYMTRDESGYFENIFTYPLHFTDEEEEYILCVSGSSERTDYFLDSVKKSIPIVLAIAIVISFAGAKIFSYYMKKPIVRMSKIAQMMAEQNFDWYCPDERNDEIGVLAKSLNKLSDELSSALSKLSDKNLYLENEITLEKERERRRMLFFSGVSHELKTPISVVIGQIEGMRSGIGVYKDKDKYLEKCGKTLNELVDFINEILLVSHIDMGDMDSSEIVKIDGILDEEIAFYDGLITEKKIDLEYNVPDNVDFRGNEQLLKKALGNILGNAFKYTPEGGRVKVELNSKSDGKVKLRIFNSPAHIEEQHLQHLFEAFYRADTSNKDGSGLGLYITGMVMEMFGAKYSIENSAEGVEFTVIQ